MRKRLLRGALAGLFLMTAANAWALDEVDGCYQIGTAQDLVDFATLVNEGKDAANAVLTADIDMTGVEWTNISVYRGVFDGQGHSITNFNYTTTGDNQGFFAIGTTTHFTKTTTCTKREFSHEKTFSNSQTNWAKNISPILNRTKPFKS